MRLLPVGCLGYRNPPTRLLEVIAISGQPIRIDEAATVADAGKSAAATLTHMRSERLVRLFGSGSDALVETWHDKVRESVLETLLPERRTRLHLQLAEEIEGKQNAQADEWLKSLGNSSTPGIYELPLSDRVLDLSQHFAAAGDERAFVYQWLAAERAMRIYAVEEAYDLFRQARNTLRSQEASTWRYRFFMGMGQVCLWHKFPDHSADAFHRAVELADSHFDAAQAITGLQAVKMQLGCFDDAIGRMDQALGELNIRRPKTSVGRIISFAAKILRLTAIPKSWQVAKSETQQREAQLAQEILLGGYLGFVEKGLLNTIESISRIALYGLKTGDQTKIVLGMVFIANLWTGLGIHWLGQRYLRRYRALGLLVNDPDLAGRISFFSGLAEYYSGNLRAAELDFGKAIPFLTRCCRFEELQCCIHMNRHVQAYIQDSTKEFETAKAVAEFSTATGHAVVKCWGDYDVACAKSRAGALPTAVQSIQSARNALPQEKFLMTSAIRSSSEGYVLMQCSQYNAARRLAEYAWLVVKDGGIAVDLTLMCLPILIEGIAGPNWLNPLPNDERNLLKKTLRRAAVFYMQLPNHKAHIDRVRGRAYWRLGKQRKAIRSFEKAIQLADKKGMKYQQGKSLLDLAAVKEEGREQNRAKGIELLKKMKSVIPRAESWLLGDQYDEAVVAPEFDLEAWEAENGPVTPYLNDLEKAE